MKKWIIGLIIGILLLILMICIFFLPNLIKNRDSQFFDVWFITNQPSPELQSEQYRINYYTSDNYSLINTLINKLLSAPQSSDLKSPFATGVKIKSFHVNDFTLYLDFTKELRSMHSIDITYAICCLTKTLYGISGIDRIVIQIDSITYGKTDGYSVEDFILTPDDLLTYSDTVDFYLYSNSKQKLVSKKMSVSRFGYETTVNKVAEELVSLKCGNILPRSMEIQHISFFSGTVYIDWCNEFEKFIREENEASVYILYSFVNTLTSIDGISSVVFSINGIRKSIDTIDFNTVFYADYSYVQ